MLNKVKIGNLIYNVYYQSLEGDIGTCDPDSLTIRIDCSLPESRARETLLHEILHACCDFAGLNDDHTYSEEEIISRLSPILHSVLSENDL